MYVCMYVCMYGGHGFVEAEKVERRKNRNEWERLDIEIFPPPPLEVLSPPPTS